MNDAPLLAVEHLTMRFGGLLAIDALSFIAHAHDITATSSAPSNGAGKRRRSSIVSPDFIGRAPEALLLHRDGELLELGRMDGGYRIAREAGVARTFQNIRLFGGMTVLENLIVVRNIE